MNDTEAPAPDDTAGQSAVGSAISPAALAPCGDPAARSERDESPDAHACGAADRESTAPAEETDEGAVEASPASASEEQDAVEPPARPQPRLADLSWQECAARLATLFPAVFTPGAPKPLKLRIQTDIQLRTPALFSRRALSMFLQRHTTSNAYLRALVAAANRFDLDGQPAGEVSAEHRDAARAEIDRRIQIRQARIAAEQAARRESRRELQRTARQQATAARAAERELAVADEKRRHAQTLARAWATTTLTRANFLALKGLTDADLDAALELARSAPAAAPAAFERAAPQRPAREGLPRMPGTHRPGSGAKR